MHSAALGHPLVSTVTWTVTPPAPTVTLPERSSAVVGGPGPARALPHLLHLTLGCTRPSAGRCRDVVGDASGTDRDAVSVVIGGGR